MEDKIIMVLYVGIGNMLDADVERYVRSITTSMFPEGLMTQMNSYVFVIPTRKHETRLECIHPKYIAKEEMVEDFKTKLDKLNDLILETKHGK